jgi:restriction system protein
MKLYYRIMLGKGSMYAEECFKDGFIGGDFGMNVDLTDKIPDHFKDFNQIYIPIYLETHPGKSKVTAGLACGNLHSICKVLETGDVVLSPDGKGNYRVGQIANNDYKYHPGKILPHRRTVTWTDINIRKSDMSKELQNSIGAIGTVCNVTRFESELESLISGKKPPVISINDETIEDVTEFAMEKHLEEFLVKNWKQTELGKNYDIYEEGGEMVGQQFQSDTGPIDILAISKDKKELLVVELKKGRVSDTVVGQIQRYMGYVLEALAEEGQKVKGVIIALEDDLKIKRALSVTTNIEFYRYQVSFKLFKS